MGNGTAVGFIAGIPLLIAGMDASFSNKTGALAMLALGLLSLMASVYNVSIREKN